MSKPKPGTVDEAMGELKTLLDKWAKKHKKKRLAGEVLGYWSNQGMSQATIAINRYPAETGGANE
jgi:hypothetical protein